MLMCLKCVCERAVVSLSSFKFVRSKNLPMKWGIGINDEEGENRKIIQPLRKAEENNTREDNEHRAYICNKFEHPSETDRDSHEENRQIFHVLYTSVVSFSSDAMTVELLTSIYAFKSHMQTCS